MTFNLNNWLRKTPQPVVILCDDKRVDVPKNGRQWRDLANTIASLDPSQLTLLDAKDTVIRSMLRREPDADADDTAESSAVTRNSTATLLSNAYDKAYDKAAPLIENSLGYVDRLSARLVHAEMEIDVLRRNNATLQLQINELTLLGQQEEGGGILAQLLAGQQAGAADAAAKNAGPKLVEQKGKSK